MRDLPDGEVTLGVAQIHCDVSKRGVGRHHPVSHLKVSKHPKPQMRQIFLAAVQDSSVSVSGDMLTPASMAFASKSCGSCWMQA